MEGDELQREPEASLSEGSYGKDRAHQKPRYPGAWAIAVTKGSRLRRTSVKNKGPHRGCGG